ncbi:uncharacterized protein DS421_8g234520 [Arachis hypogaea]|nr:uncharacterized protein DS421_8g234520 [Arachis hypogaea]
MGMDNGLEKLSDGIQVVQAEVLPKKITSYSFTSAVWKGLVPPRIALFSWCGVRSCVPLEGSGALQKGMPGSSEIRPSMVEMITRSFKVSKDWSSGDLFNC